MSIVIPRSVWKPNFSNGATDNQGQPIIIGTSAWEAAGRELWAHHSVTNPPGPDATLEQDCAHMRHFESIGQSSFRQGISYTWVIMPSGRVFEGHSVDRRGAHTYQRNDRSRAVCFAGNFDVATLPDRMARAAALLLREIGATFDGGHRDVYATACPGRHAYARLPEINRLAVSGVPLSLEGNEMSLFTQEAKNAYDEAYRDIKSLVAVLIGAPGKDGLPLIQKHINFVVDELARRFNVRFAAIDAALTAIAADPDVTAEQMAAAVNQAVAEHSPKAEDIAASMAPAVATQVVALLPRDDEGNLTVDVDEQRIAELVVSITGSKLSAFDTTQEN
ncbi:peptidoglycan recognition family protein [Streptomyces sp. ID05-26A]|nr:peptidoglycan recognition family protein [Streptomyces sp. ID05-26A]